MQKVKTFTFKQIIAFLLAIILAFNFDWAVIKTSASNALYYLDSAGESQQAVDAITITDQTTLSTGWYVVSADTKISDRIEISGDVNIILADGCTLEATKGIHVSEGNSIAIYGQSTDKDTVGKLIVTADNYISSLGGNEGQNSGSIVINGGNITATGGWDAPGIGGGKNGVANEIIINSGFVYSKSAGGAGIGSGYYYSYSSDKKNNITINGGEVEAMGCHNGAAIGGSYNSSGGNITINGGIVTAYTEDASYDHAGSAIGGGLNGSSGNITITGGTVIATSHGPGAAIGGGSRGAVDIIKISGGNVTALNTGSYSSGVAIGSGMDASNTTGEISITGGTVIAKSDTKAGIGDANSLGTNTLYIGDDTPVVVTNSIEASTHEDMYTGLVIVGTTGKLYSSTTLESDLTIDSGVTVEIPEDIVLSVAKGVTLTNNGTIETATDIKVYGNLINNGTINGNTKAVATNISYLDDKGDSQVVLEATQITESSTTLSSGWYVVNANTTINNRIEISGDVNIILADGCTLEATSGITVNEGNRLTIYSQSLEDEMGKLVAKGSASDAGIGSTSGNTSGAIIINGGDIAATADGYNKLYDGYTSSAAIGSGKSGKGGTITINNGKITAQTGTGAAAIGVGSYANGGTITINGGTISATGGSTGIGAGNGSNNRGGTITINGGDITAEGDQTGIGIGYTGLEPTVTITGGNVNAKGYYAGIGVGGYAQGGLNLTISGGNVTAIAENGTGIGNGTGWYGQSMYVNNDNSYPVVMASSISSLNNEDDKSNWVGIVFDGTTGKTYGEGTFDGELTLPDESTLYIEEGFVNEGIINVPEGTKLVIYSDFTNSKGQIYIDGEVEFNTEAALDKENIFYKVNVTNGTAKVNSAEIEYAPAGTIVTLTSINPESNYYKTWSINGKNLGNGESKFTMPSAVANAEMAGFRVELAIEDFTYLDEAKYPSIVVTDLATNDTLTPSDVEYYYSDSNNDNVREWESYTSTILDAGTYKMCAVVIMDGYEEYKTEEIEFTVNKKEVEVPKAEHVTYDGKKHDATYIDTDLYHTEDLSCITNAGTAEHVLKLYDTTNYKWEGYADDITTIDIGFVIDPRPVEIEWSDDTSGMTYNGSEKTVTAKVKNICSQSESEDIVNFEIDNKKNTDAGTYTATITAIDNSNYTIKDVDNLTYEYTIERAKNSWANTPLDVVWVYGMDHREFTYEDINGNVATVSYRLQGSDDEYTNVEPTEVGEYDMKYSIAESQNYKELTIVKTLHLNRQSISFDGTEYSITKHYGDEEFNISDYFKTNSTGSITYEIKDDSIATIDENGNVSIKNAGETTITVSVAISDTVEKGSVDITLTVEQAVNTWKTIPVISDKVYDSTAIEYLAKSEFGEVTVYYGTLFDWANPRSDTDYGEWGMYLSTSPKNTTAPTSSGRYSAMFKVAGTDNYNEITYVVNFTISSKVVELEWSGLTEKTYDGEDCDISAIVTNAIDGDQVIVNLTDEAETNVGNYVATASSLSNANYTLNGAENTTFEYSINTYKPEIIISVDDTELEEDDNIILDYGDSVTLNVAYKDKGDAEAKISFESTDEAIALVEDNTSENSVTVVANKKGTTSIKISVEETSNYEGISVEKTITVNPKEITVTADNITKKYSESDPVLTYTTSATLIGTDKFTGALTREDGEKVETYKISQGTLALDDNYNITFKEGTFTIEKNPGATLAETEVNADTKSTTENKVDDLDRIVETTVTSEDGSKVVTEYEQNEKYEFTGRHIVTKYDAEGEKTEKITYEESGRYVKEGFDPELIEGNGSKYVPEDKTLMTFRSDDELINFTEVRINGVLLDAQYYDVVHGSIRVTLHQDYLATLKPGTYTMDIVSTNGDATGKFTINAPATNEDDNNSSEKEEVKDNVVKTPETNKTDTTVVKDNTSNNNTTQSTTEATPEETVASVEEVTESTTTTESTDSGVTTAPATGQEGQDTIQTNIDEQTDSFNFNWLWLLLAMLVIIVITEIIYNKNKKQVED